MSSAGLAVAFRRPARAARRVADAIPRRVRGRRLARSELIVPVTCTRPLIGELLDRFPGAVACDHVTLIDPFFPPRHLGPAVEEAVGQVLRDFASFSYELGEIERFPGVLYMAPRPAEPFIALTEALQRRFPQYPPYGGAFETIVPHVTLALSPEPPGIVDHVESLLPLRDVAAAVWLKTRGPDGAWRVRREFRLGAGG